MASKQYISIIRLFNHCGISTGDDINLSRARKQLQAEFGIAQGGFIELEGYVYTRHDVFEEIERPDFQKRLGFHRQIWNSPALLGLLEKNTVDFPELKTEILRYVGNKEFDEFFSPYFATPFSYLSRTFLSAGQLIEMGNLLAYEDFLQPDEREEAFRSLRIFLDDNMRTLRNVNGENYNIMRPKIAHWIDTDWALLFNNLPHEFYEIKNDIASRLINIGVAVQKTHRSDCRRMSEQLIALQDLPESLSGIIISNHAVYTGATRSSKSFSWGNGFWVVWLLFMVIKGASGGCGNTDNTYYKEIPFKYIPPDSLVKIVKDSDVRILPDTIFKIPRHKPRK